MQALDPQTAYSSSAVLAASSEDNAKASQQISDLAREVASEFSTTTYAPMMVRGLIQLGDFAVLTTIGLISSSFMGGSVLAGIHLPLAFSAAGALLFLLFMLSTDGYAVHEMHSLAPQVGKIIGAWTLVTVLFLLVTYLSGTPIDENRSWLGLWFFAGISSIAAVRAIQAYFIHHWQADGRLERRAVIVGGGQPAADIIQSLENQVNNDIRICGIFDDRDDDRSPAIVAGYPKLGNVDDLVEFSRLCNIDMLIVTIPVTAENRVLQMLHKLWVLPLDIHLSAHMNKMQFRRRSYSYVGNLPTVPVFAKPIANWGSLLKRVFDIVISCVTIVVLSPVLIGTAIAIKRDSEGPVIFKQKRLGFNNEEVLIYKFRSLYHNQSDEKAAKSVTKGDSRVTKVGRFIRKTSIDELPQLFNVLLGTLSLVGPRPHVPHQLTDNRLFEEVADGYMARHKVKPGITGWAQIHGWRGEIDDDNKLKQRVQHDIYYIENWSLALDLYILAVTPLKLFNQDGAY
ncbi:undecaprenyl-phosphate glucose phosphotransferase [Cohaesibacter celericrescens]|uniref:Undecaprenyl-phosphate glucose phosphotransferase n=1 Tax=Cohaesibacter celericrescens TaxID=2067669 RepID=A0A2N5XQD6_9HYPH|nr:undecaprenyl-phosphate glucose phosphotransferase [Cohaesibacter celericrescens]PLW76703.1 undecaprenyl-phosphate glucose phosphotransferase [Cohaesibacter celericrescens]